MKLRDLQGELPRLKPAATCPAEGISAPPVWQNDIPPLVRHLSVAFPHFTLIAKGRVASRRFGKPPTAFPRAKRVLYFVDETEDACSGFREEGKRFMPAIATPPLQDDEKNAALIGRRLQTTDAATGPANGNPEEIPDHDGLWDWDLEANRVYFSPRWKAILGFQDGEIGTGPDEWLGRVHPDDLAQVQADLVAHQQAQTPLFNNEHRLRHKNNTYRWVRARGQTVVSRESQRVRIAGSLTDITNAKLADPLTGLPNRVFFLERLGNVLKRSSNSRFGALLVDIDCFKAINANFGRACGDQLLIAVACRLEGCVRKRDTIARMAEDVVAHFGGDEFTVLLESVKNVENAVRIADRVLEKLTQPLTLDGRQVSVGASVGVVLGPGNYDRPEDILRDAETAKTRAKAQGKAGCAVFEAPAG
jgi:diguanylate cyclase (GGDEF)-like protein/PAS domain S-box-containing protein